MPFWRKSRIGAVTGWLRSLRILCMQDFRISLFRVVQKRQSDLRKLQDNIISKNPYKGKRRKNYGNFRNSESDQTADLYRSHRAAYGGADQNGAEKQGAETGSHPSAAERAESGKSKSCELQQYELQ